MLTFLSLKSMTFKCLILIESCLRYFKCVLQNWFSIYVNLSPNARALLLPLCDGWLVGWKTENRIFRVLNLDRSAVFCCLAQVSGLLTAGTNWCLLKILLYNVYTHYYMGCTKWWDFTYTLCFSKVVYGRSGEHGWEITWDPWHFVIHPWCYD